MKKLIIRKTEEIENWRRNINCEINFIPTMGNLHNGHIKLISTAKNDNYNVNLVSIFINPLQFDNNLDLENYPKTIDNDIKISFSNGADAIFIPSNEAVSYTHLRAHETRGNLVCRLLLEKKLINFLSFFDKWTLRELKGIPSKSLCVGMDLIATFNFSLRTRFFKIKSCCQSFSPN